MKRFFDPAQPITLLRWRDVRAVSWDESRVLLAGGAKWLPLAHGPFEKTERGSKSVEVRNRRPWLDAGKRLEAGRVVILGRGRTGRRLAAVVAERLDVPNLASAPASWIAGAELDAEAIA